jgi:hypothetical protein
MIDFEALILGSSLQKIRKIKNEYRFCCPFHSDKTPSSFFNIDKGVFICFGCGFKCGYARFFEQLGISVGDSFYEVRFEKEPEQYNSYEDYLCAYENSLEKGLWHFNYTEPVYKHPDVVDWISSRLYHPDLERFHIPLEHGYNPKRNSVLFKSRHNIVEKLLQGKYMNYGDPAHLFTDTKTAGNKPLVLVEGVFDWLVLRQMEKAGAGFCSAAILGTAITDTKLADIAAINPPEVILAYDNDKAGEKGFKDNFYRVMQVVPNVSKVTPIDGIKDFGDMPFSLIEKSIENRKQVYEYFIEDLCYEY